VGDCILELFGSVVFFVFYFIPKKIYKKYIFEFKVMPYIRLRIINRHINIKPPYLEKKTNLTCLQGSKAIFQVRCNFRSPVIGRFIVSFGLFCFSYPGKSHVEEHM